MVLLLWFLTQPVSNQAEITKLPSSSSSSSSSSSPSALLFFTQNQSNLLPFNSKLRSQLLSTLATQLDTQNPKFTQIFKVNDQQSCNPDLLKWWLRPAATVTPMWPPAPPKATPSSCNTTQRPEEEKHHPIVCYMPLIVTQTPWCCCWNSARCATILGHPIQWKTTLLITTTCIRTLMMQLISKRSWFAAVIDHNQLKNCCTAEICILGWISRSISV